MSRIGINLAVATLLIAGWAQVALPEVLAQQVEQVSSPARTLTPKDVARLESVGEVAISPDGSTVAYTRIVQRQPGQGADGAAWSRLHAVRFNGDDDRAYVGGEVNVSQLRWSPDGRYLSYLSRRPGDESTSIYVIPARAGESYRLFQHETSVLSFDWRPDGRAIAFVASEAASEARVELRKRGFDQEVYEEDWLPRRLYVLDLPGGADGPPGEVRQVEVPGHPWHAVWGPDGRRILTDLSPTPLIDDRYMFRRLHVIDATSGAVLARIDNPGKLGAFGFAPDGRTIALVSGIDINDPREGRLMVVPSEGGALRDLLPELEGHVENFAFVGPQRIVYLASVGVGTRIGRVRTNGRDGRIDYEGTDPVFTDLSLSPESRRVALIGQAPTHPSEAFALSLEEGRPSRLTDVNPWLADIRLAEQSAVGW
jgi:dipeptidyl aminopeptidase/acylaminoacyl peptidase